MGDPTTLVYVVVFMGVLLLVEGCYYLFVDARGDGRRNINRRLRMMAEGLDSATVLSRLRRKPLNAPQGLGAKLAELPIFKYIEKLLTEAGLTITTFRFALRIGIGYVAVVAVLIALNVIRPLPLGLLLVIVTLAAVGGPFFVLRRLARRRMSKLEHQLPDSLDMLVRSLRAGHPISSSIQLVARETGDPIGTEFGLAFDEMTYGRDLQQALENMARRVPLPDMSYVVVAIKLQQISGGNLAEVLSNLARLVRERQRLRLKILALSAEGRFSTKILSALPFGILAIVSIGNPQYYGAMLRDPVLMYIMGGALVALIIAIMIMRKIVNFQV